ncbi:MAG: hypothetical protein HYX61_12440 [Gammaproteobacteria bacterium]|jgi:hypothetical protein|nr:hypothetical protein [Gammaproteobacteria bacterium]
MSGGVAFRFFRLIFSFWNEREQSGSDTELEDDMSVDENFEEDDEDDLLVSVDGLSMQSDLPPDVLLMYLRPGSRHREEQLQVSPYNRAYTPNGISQIHKRFLKNGQNRTISPKERRIFEEAANRILAPYIPGLVDSWFNTQIINRWFDYLSEKYQEQKIANIHCEHDKSYLNTIGVDDWNQEDRQRLLDANHIFWPRYNGSHWYVTLIEISKDSKEVKIKCLDGFNSHKKHAQFIKEGEKLFEALYGIDHGFKIRRQSYAIPKQHNTDDCGPVICYQAERVCNGYGIFTKGHGDGVCDYSQVRPRVAQVLAGLPSKVFVRGYIPHGHTKDKVVIDLDPDPDPAHVRKKRKFGD